MLVRGSNSTAAFLHISQNVIAQRIISLFNGRSLRLREVHFEILRSQFRKNQKNKPKKTKNNKRTKKNNISGILEIQWQFSKSTEILFFFGSFVFFGFVFFVFFGFVFLFFPGLVLQESGD